MVICSDFLERYSDYRDGLLDLSAHRSMVAHLEGCPSCARYDRVLATGVVELRELPQVEPSFEFLDRLQHRLYHLEDDVAWWSRRNTSGTSVGFVAILAILIALAAWLPMMRPGAAPIELPPIAAVAPPVEEVVAVHSLFRTGPLLSPPPARMLGSSPASGTVFFRYTPLGAYADYSTVPLRPR